MDLEFSEEDLGFIRDALEFYAFSRGVSFLPQDQDFLAKYTEDTKKIKGLVTKIDLYLKR